MGFVMDDVALGQVFLQVLRFSPVSMILPLFHIHLCINWGWTMGPLEAAVPQNSPRHNNKNKNNTANLRMSWPVYYTVENRLSRMSG
jgi:hypothetical protein